jgi:hypothetical protein
MTEPIAPPRTARQPHYKTHVDWAALFAEVQEAGACASVAARHGLNPRTLRKRYSAWREAQASGDRLRMDVAEGKIDGRRYTRSALGLEADNQLADRVRALKEAGKPVTRELIASAAMDLWRELHARVTRSTVPFVASPQFITRFRRRHNFSTTHHRTRVDKPMTEEQENERINETAEYHMHVQDAVQRVGPSLVLNADETMARAVEQPKTSWGVRGKPNIVNVGLDPRRGITTNPTIASDGTLLPLQAIVKGKTQRAVNNKRLPLDVVADHTESGWQTGTTQVNHIHNIVAPYTHDQPSALILDDYKAHSTPAVQSAAAEHNIDLIPVPKGQTAELQPLDVGVNGEIKSRARARWVRDKQTGRVGTDTLTRAVERINDAAHTVAPSTIASSFSRAVPTFLPR